MAHEDLTRKDEVKVSSERSFGYVFGAVFAIIAVWPLLQGQPPRWWSIGVSAVFVLLALLKPVALAVPNRLWSRLGVVLGKVVSPIALGILFYGVLTPIGLVMRLIGRDPLHLKMDPNSKSYWISRDPPGPPPNSMTNQF